MQLLVKRQDDRTNGMNLVAIDGSTVVRVNQLDLVAALLQDPDELTERPSKRR